MLVPRSHNLVLHRPGKPGPLWTSGFKSQLRRFLIFINSVDNYYIEITNGKIYK